MIGAYVITTLEQPPVKVADMFVPRSEYGVTLHDYSTTSIADAAMMKALLIQAGISGALKPPSNTRSTMARSVAF